MGFNLADRKEGDRLIFHKLQEIAFVGIMGTGLLLVIAFVTKLTGGLIFSIPVNLFKNWSDPTREKERQAGKRFSYLVFKYVPPFFIGFVVILLISYLFN